MNSACLCLYIIYKYDSFVSSALECGTTLLCVSQCVCVCVLYFNSLSINNCFDLLVNDVASRKRHKKDHGKTSIQEERRGSGDHRRSGGCHQKSGSRHREPKDSDEGSPPPSLSDGACFCIGLLLGIKHFCHLKPLSPIPWTVRLCLKMLWCFLFVQLPTN